MNNDTLCVVMRPRPHVALARTWNIFTYASKADMETAKLKSDWWGYCDYVIAYKPDEVPAFSAWTPSTRSKLANAAARDLVQTKLEISLSDRLDFQFETERLMFVLKFG